MSAPPLPPFPDPNTCQAQITFADGQYTPATNPGGATLLIKVSGSPITNLITLPDNIGVVALATLINLNIITAGYSVTILSTDGNPLSLLVIKSSFVDFIATAECIYTEHLCSGGDFDGQPCNTDMDCPGGGVCTFYPQSNTGDFACNIAPSCPFDVSPLILPDAIVDTPYSTNIVASGGAPPYVFTFFNLIDNYLRGIKAIDNGDGTATLSGKPTSWSLPNQLRIDTVNPNNSIFNVNVSGTDKMTWTMRLVRGCQSWELFNHRHESNPYFNQTVQYPMPVLTDWMSDSESEIEANFYNALKSFFIGKVRFTATAGYPIVAVAANQFKIEGDHTTEFDTTIRVQDSVGFDDSDSDSNSASEVNNDGTYTIAGINFIGGFTYIDTVESLPSSRASGYVWWNKQSIISIEGIGTKFWGNQNDTCQFLVYNDFGQRFSTAKLIESLANAPILFNIQVNDDNGCEVDQQEQISFVPVCPVILISPSTLPDGEVDHDYAQTVVTGDGVAPYTWTKSGSFPPNWTLNSASGEIQSGTLPNIPGTYTFTIYVMDVNECQGCRTYTINIDKKLELYIPGDKTNFLRDVTQFTIADDKVVANNGTFDIIEYRYDVATNFTIIKYINNDGSTEIPCTGNVTWVTGQSRIRPVQGTIAGQT